MENKLQKLIRPTNKQYKCWNQNNNTIDTQVERIEGVRETKLSGHAQETMNH
jgi:hypothetical protein